MPWNRDANTYLPDAAVVGVDDAFRRVRALVKYDLLLPADADLRAVARVREAVHVARGDQALPQVVLCVGGGGGWSGEIGLGCVCFKGLREYERGQKKGSGGTLADEMMSPVVVSYNATVWSGSMPTVAMRSPAGANASNCTPAHIAEQGERAGRESRE